MIEFQMLHPYWTPDHLGFLPHFLSAKDPRPAREQFHAKYPFGGWSPTKGWRLTPSNVLHYPGDPPLVPRASARLRDELIVVYDSAWVAIINADRSFEVARLD